MKALKSILKLKADQSIILLLAPALIGAIVAAFLYKNSAPATIYITLAFGVWLTLGGSILYTSMFCYGTLKREIPWQQTLGSILVLLLYFIFIEGAGTRLFLGLTFFSLEIWRAYKIASLWLQAEGRRKNFLDFMVLIWIIVNPLIGIWSLHRRAQQIIKLSIN